MAESKASFDAVLVSGFDEAYKHGLGAYFFTARDESILAMVPSGDDEPPRLVAFNIGKNGGPRWQWDGNRESPTLSPSLHCIGHWHGFLRNGRFESV